MSATSARATSTSRISGESSSPIPRIPVGSAPCAASVTSSTLCERIRTERWWKRRSARIYSRCVSVIGFDIRTAQLTPSTYVVSVAGEIDAFTSPALEQELDWVLGDGASNAVVDLANVGFIDSTALRVLLKA